jgi:hypothetical protein
MNGRNETAVAIMSRVPENELFAIENWRRAQPRIPTLSRAIRELIRRGIEADKTRAEPSEESAA